MAEKKREPGRPPGSKNKSSRTKSSARTGSKAREKAQEIQSKKKADRRVIDEIWAIISIALGVFLIVATFTEGAGQLGEMIGDFLKGLFGFMAYVLLSYSIRNTAVHKESRVYIRKDNASLAFAAFDALHHEFYKICRELSFFRFFFGQD